MLLSVFLPKCAMFKQNNIESRTYAYNKLKKENKQYEAG